MNEFGTLNWAILIIYVIANLILGYVLGKKINTEQDFFLAGKQRHGGPLVFLLSQPMSVP